MKETTHKPLPMPLSLENSKDIEKFIANTPSEIYGGKNNKGQHIIVTLQQGVSMEVRTFQSNGWIRTNIYNKYGWMEEELYDK